MANLILYLLRHGESVSNVKRVFAARKIDLPLSDMGIQQATMQAKSLRDLSLNSQFGFSALYASSLLRARHTANIVGQWCGLEPIFSDDLMEVDVGVLDGESQEHPVKWAMYEEVIKKWEQGLHNVGFQDGESLNDIEYRFRRFLEELESKQAEPEDEIRNGIKRSEAVHEAEGMSLLCHCVARNEAITKQSPLNEVNIFWSSGTACFSWLSFGYSAKIMGLHWRMATWDEDICR